MHNNEHLPLTGIECPEKATGRPFQRDRAKPKVKGGERSEPEGEINSRSASFERMTHLWFYSHV